MRNEELGISTRPPRLPQITQIKIHSCCDVICVNLRDLRGKLRCYSPGENPRSGMIDLLVDWSGCICFRSERSLPGS